MKYLLLAYTSLTEWDNLDPTDPEFIAGCEFYEKLGAELTASGELVSTEGLSHPALSRTVRRGADGPVASEGPFAESKEVLVSFSIVDCDSMDRALSIAGRITEAVGDTIEVRPIPDGPPE